MENNSNRLGIATATKKLDDGASFGSSSALNTNSRCDASAESVGTDATTLWCL